MDLSIKRDGALSIHIQLKEQIKGLVIDNVLENGAQLPTVRQLGDFLRINKNTVSKVYKDLEKEGYVYSIKGRGTFVRNSGKSEKVQGFIREVEKLLKIGHESGIGIDEIYSIVYSKSQQYRALNYSGDSKKIAFIECNTTSIKEFKDMIAREINDYRVQGILIGDLKSDFDSVKDKIKDAAVIIIPYIHYEEVKTELSKIGKEVVTIGTNQSLKILAFARKLKNKKVGFISLSSDDEKSILKQFSRISMKESYLYGGLEEEGESGLFGFIGTKDFLVICSSIYDRVEKSIQISKPFIKFESKFDKTDIRNLKEMFRNR